MFICPCRGSRSRYKSTDFNMRMDRDAFEGISLLNTGAEDKPLLETFNTGDVAQRSLG